MLSFFGPVIVVLLVLVWASALTVGAALVMYPTLGTSIRASSGETPTDLTAALYAGGSSIGPMLTTPGLSCTSTGTYPF